jgi:glycerophosphoryl diester phosphodiesterase
VRLSLPLAAVLLAGCIDDGVIIIAHRGASFDAPEHTFAAWDLARRQGADWLELDLQMTRDSVLVVMHDDSLDRTARGPREACAGLVRERTRAELARCDVGSWFNAEFPERAAQEYVGARIPTLDQVLTRYADGARFYIEIKGDGMERELLDALRRHRLIGPTARAGRVYVQSFSADALQRLHALDPSVPLVQLLEDPVPAAEMPSAFAAIARYAVGIGPSRRIAGGALVRAAHEAGLLVHVYTVNEPAAMVTFLQLGVDGLFTDRPALLRDLLNR